MLDSISVESGGLGLRTALPRHKTAAMSRNSPQHAQRMNCSSRSPDAAAVLVCLQILCHHAWTDCRAHHLVIEGRRDDLVPQPTRIELWRLLQVDVVPYARRGIRA